MESVYGYRSTDQRLATARTLVDPLGSATVAQDLGYGYDTAGNLLSVSDARGRLDQTFSYDTLHRLREAFGSGTQGYGLLSYSYDAAGNLREKGPGTAGSPAAGRLKLEYGRPAAGGPATVVSFDWHDGSAWVDDFGAYDYDADGGMTFRRILFASYDLINGRDPEGRMALVALPGSAPGSPRFEHYAYDEAGQRSEKTRTGYGASVMEHRRYVDASYEVDVVAGTHQLHLFVGARRVVTAKRSGLGTDTDAGTTQDVVFYHPDHVGSNTVLTDASGQIVQESFLRPFGQTHALLDGKGQPVAPANTATPYLFTDQERDANTGLDYFGARSYDPIIGRFLSQDPELIGAGSGVTFGRIEGDGQNLNAYTYVLNRPTRLVDPSGRFADLTISMVDWDGRNTSYFFTASSAVSAGLGTANTGAGAMAINNVMTGGNLGSPGSAAGTSGAPATGGAAGAAQGGGFWQGVGDYLGNMFSNEFKDIAGGVLGPLIGIGEGIYNIGAGILDFRPTQIGVGLLQIGVVGMLRLAADGGLMHPSNATVVQPLLSLLRSGSQPSIASQNHDPKMTDPAYGYLSSKAHGEWIIDAWANPLVQPGPYGQAYRLYGTVGFGIAWAGLKAIGN